MLRVVDVTPLEGHWIRVRFSDGAVMEIDVGGLLSRGGVFAPIRDDRGLFEQVRVNPQSRTVEWPGEVDVDPEVLYGRRESAFGTEYGRRVIRTSTASAA